MASTPPLRNVDQIPATPLYGAKYDVNHMNSRRRSTRQKQVTMTTPNQTAESADVSRIPVQPGMQRIRKAAEQQCSSASEQTLPARKKAKLNHFSQAAPGPEEFSSATTHDPFYDPANNPTIGKPAMHAGKSMLPTPVKTPKKKQVQHASLNAASRALFIDRNEDPMPTPRKYRKGKRSIGFSLYSSQEDGEDTAAGSKIPIFTDSKDKVPELDPSEDNPFLIKPKQTVIPPEPSKGRGLKKKSGAGKTEQTSKQIEEAFQREEGMVYVFRGKKVYRKFPTETDSDDDATVNSLDKGDGRSDRTGRTRPAKGRGAIKPRLLFPPTAPKTDVPEVDMEAEEALTDIDYEAMQINGEDTEIITPIKTSFNDAPFTPPTTVHATRSATKKALGNPNATTPTSPTRTVRDKGASMKGSPFNDWRRSKHVGSPGVGAKRSR